jgi:hypothetical protein
MQEWLNHFTAVWYQADIGFLLVFGVFFIGIYFLPTFLAVFFNRTHLSKIAVLNIPAGFSLIAWGALLVWACTGKLGETLRQRLERQANRNES